MTTVGVMGVMGSQKLTLDEEGSDDVVKVTWRVVGVPVNEKYTFIENKYKQRKKES